MGKECNVPSDDRCHFCVHYPAVVTVSRSHPGVPEKLRLCERCAYTLQVVLQVNGLEQSLPVPPCLMCKKGSVVTVEANSKEGERLGRYRLCADCAQTHSWGMPDVLKLCTLWTPGILELPPPMERVFPPPPGRDRPSQN